MSGKAALASMASFALVWILFALTVPSRPGWLIEVMTYAAIVLSVAAGIGVGAYIDTRRKD